MKIKNVIPLTYGLIHKELAHFPLNLDKQEVEHVRQLEELFEAYNYAGFKEKNTNASVKNSKHYLAEITDYSLIGQNPKIALVGNLYLHEIYKDFQYSDQLKKMEKPYQKSQKKMDKFFRKLPESPENTGIKIVYAKSNFQTNKVMAQSFNHENYSRIANTLKFE